MGRSPLKVVVFSPYYPPAYRAGGPAKSISRLVRASSDGFTTRVVSRNWDLGVRERLTDRRPTLGSTRERRRSGRTTAVSRPTSEPCWRVARDRPRLVYVNSLFDPWMAIVPALAWWVVGSRRSDLVLAPRGQLAAGALAKSAFRKRPLLWFWRRLVHHRRVVVHAATEQEMGDVERVLGRRRGHRAPQRRRAAPPGTRRACDRGRTARGLPGTDRAHQGAARVAEVATEHRAANVAGHLRTGGGQGATCSSAGAKRACLPDWVRVQFKGPVASEAVRPLLAKYDVMLNPTRGESFGQAIGESLSVGTPVAVAPVTPWTSWIEDSHGGTDRPRRSVGLRRTLLTRCRRPSGRSSARAPGRPTRTGGGTPRGVHMSSSWPFRDRPEPGRIRACARSGPTTVPWRRGPECSTPSEGRSDTPRSAAGGGPGRTPP